MSNHWKIYSLRRGDYRFYHGIGGILDKIGDYLERNWWDICLPSRSAIFFHTGVPQELLKRALLDYLVGEPISFPLDRNNNNNNSRPMRMKRVEANIIYFLMRRRILLVNSCVRWDKKGWKSLSQIYVHTHGYWKFEKRSGWCFRQMIYRWHKHHQLRMLLQHYQRWLLPLCWHNRYD